MISIDRIAGAIMMIVILFAAGYIAILKGDIRSLHSKIDKAKSEKIIESQNLQQCSRELQALNDRIEQERSDYRSRVEHYEAMLKQKPKVRYKVIYRTIQEKKSDECEDIKAMLDGVRHTSFDSLR